MQINNTKTHVLFFAGRKAASPPQLTINNERLEVTESTVLLGVVMQYDVGSSC